MTYEMKNLRKEDLSLYYYLKNNVLVDFIEKEEYIPLEFISSASCCYTSNCIYDCLY